MLKTIIAQKSSAIHTEISREICDGENLENGDLIKFYIPVQPLHSRHLLNLWKVVVRCWNWSKHQELQERMAMGTVEQMEVETEKIKTREHGVAAPRRGKLAHWERVWQEKKKSSRKWWFSSLREIQHLGKKSGSIISKLGQKNWNILWSIVLTH